MMETKILAKIRVGFSPFLVSKQISTCNKQKEDSSACSMPKPGDSFSFFTVLRCFKLCQPSVGGSEENSFASGIPPILGPHFPKKKNDKSRRQKISQRNFVHFC